MGFRKAIVAGAAALAGLLAAGTAQAQNVQVGVLQCDVSGGVGLLLERIVIRYLYGRLLETLLAIWGISLVLIQVVRLVFGA